METATAEGTLPVADFRVSSPDYLKTMGARLLEGRYLREDDVASVVEMEDMVSSGMTPSQVLVAATRNGADLCGWSDLGTVEAGKSADFEVLEANPLDDIKNARRISSVYLRGVKVDRDALRARWSSPKTE